jgi:uncharacterized membrane protein YadS
VPGITLAVGLGVASLALTRLLPPSPLISHVVVAILLGALVINTRLRSLVGLAPRGGAEREPDRAAAGLRFTGKWILRLGIILMGLQVETRLFGGLELSLIFGVAAVALPSTFHVAHTMASALALRRPLADLIAGGTMICGASAVNAIAPVAGRAPRRAGGRHRRGLRYSVVALFSFQPVAAALGLSPAMAGLWAGLAVNDLSSAVAVGAQMGGAGGTMAAAAKSVRILLLAPLLLVLSLLRREGAQSIGKGIREQLPRFVLGYVALAALRALGDRLWPASPAWSAVLVADRWLVDLLMTTVSAGIGLHLVARGLLGAGARALAAGAGAWAWLAGLSLAMIALAARGQVASAALIALIALAASYAGYRLTHRHHAQLTRLRHRFAQGSPISLTEATALLDASESDGAQPDDDFRLRVLRQLHPTIGELVPVRESPLEHGEGCRWVTYWQGGSGWALVAVCREPARAPPSTPTPSTASGQGDRGVLEELRFDDLGGAAGCGSAGAASSATSTSSSPTGCPRCTWCASSAPSRPSICSCAGPEQGGPGRLLRVDVDPASLSEGMELSAIEDVDARPGHGGEGAGAVGKIQVKEIQP